MKNENLYSYSFEAQILVLTSRLKLDSSTLIKVPASALGMNDISGYHSLTNKS